MRIRQFLNSLNVLAVTKYQQVYEWTEFLFSQKEFWDLEYTKDWEKNIKEIYKEIKLLVNFWEIFKKKNVFRTDYNRPTHMGTIKKLIQMVRLKDTMIVIFAVNL